ncbi:acetyl-CoA carboxylase, carboxyltransferase subunit beta [Thalassospira lucentensis]|uniref:acetyl-CoA carboxylase, carboxyltransferase subunit beta n=1 Tax=Thalassospira lucentensis TaxID=168935 RepID=UPI00142E5774|nr:acetyl-CoA carboxylase, carboxyltransferase subunit beta [Thalassospira lucentensis]NIZ00669.1 acetyl-CoA carboxylase carboxyltransferase subunit beta [Thalassospira lucentensis]
MSWLTEFVRPKIQQLVRRTDVPENLWHKCPSCEQMIFHRDLAKNNHVCQHCGHHMRISAKNRLELLFDEGKYQTIELPNVPVDPLKFRDQKKYTDRVKAAQAKSDFKDALAVAHGEVGGHPTVIAVFDFSFMAGSMGMAVGEGIVAAAELASVQDAALIIVPASGGARMQEGILSLMQMARTTAAIEKVKEKGLPYFVLLTDPTTGGVSASFAMLGDIQIAEPGALIGFAGRRVIENTIREKLPDDFQTAEYLLEHGMVDMVVPRNELNETFGRLIDMIRRTKPGASIVPIKDAKNKSDAKGAQTDK